MIAAWMLWSVGAGLLFLVGALAAERLVKGGRRWVWLTAAAGTVVLPALRMASSGGGAEGLAMPVAPIMLDPVTMTVSRDSTLHSLDAILLLTWVGLSTALLVTAIVAGARFLRRRASWEPGTLLGKDVLWSRDTGPAVVGLLRSRIVLPGWVRGAGNARQQLVLAHEEEHQRAGDVHARFVCGVLLIVFPWNPALWFQYRRLNLAIELDCDQRVMNRLPDQRRLYGDLLLRVGSRNGALPGLAVAALAEQRSLLERRIRELLSRAPEVRMAQAAFLVFGAVLVVGLALSIPGITGEGPTEPVLLHPEAEVVIVPPAREEAEELDVSARPVFTPYTVKPDYINRAEIREALQREYPPLLRDAGIGGTAVLWFYIDEQGTVRNQLVHTSSGHEALDQAALRVAALFKFTPALNRDQAVPVWVMLPATFRAAGDSGGEAAATEAEVVRRQAVEEARERAAEATAAEELDVSAAPVFTPYTTKPEYTNADEIRAALEREYPPLLRDAGVGGTTVIWFFINERGEVENERIATTSGSDALDEAALRVAPVFRFTPAENRGEAVPAWVQLPITFTVR